MPFIGKTPSQGFVNSVTKDDFTPNGTTTAFTLSKSPATVNEIEVYVGNVRQEPTDAYSVSGTTLTMTEAPVTGTNFYVMHIGGTTQSSTVVPDGAVTSAKLASDLAVTGKLGIGVTSPTGKVHIKNDSAVATNTQTAYNNASLRLDNLNTGSSVGLSFGLLGANTNYIQGGYNEGTVAPIALNPYGGGVAIGGTAAANTMDEYEEGTWIPTYTDDAGNVITNLTNQNGRYVKVGNLVYISGNVRTQGSSSTSGLSGNLSISGLPFTQVSTEASGTVSFFTHESSGSYNAPAQLPRTSPVSSNTTKIRVYKYSGSGGRTVRFLVSDLTMSGNSNFMFFQGTYEAS
jgi:hypothetical protein